MAPLENMIQDFVNSLSEGFVSRLIRVLVFLILAVAIFGIYFASQFRGLRDAASMEYAQLARNVATGKGFVTGCIRPADLAFVSGAKGAGAAVAACPDVRQPPFFPAVLALGFKLAGVSAASPDSAESRVIVPVCVLFTILTGVIVYLAAFRLFGRAVAVVSVLLFFLSKSVLDDSISGLPGSLLAFLASAVFFAAVSFRDAYERSRPAWQLAYLFGSMAILGAAAILASYQMIVYVAVMAFFVVAGFLRRGLMTACAFLLLVCLLVSPWAVRNWKACGHPFGLAPYEALYDTTIHKGDSFDRQLAPVTDSARIVRAVKQKFIARLTDVLELNLKSAGNGLIICLFLVSLFHKHERDEVNQLKVSLLVVLLLSAGAASVFLADPGLAFRPFMPLVAMFGVAFFFTVLAGNEFADFSWKVMMTSVLVLVTAFPAVVAVLGRQGRIPYPPYYPPFVSHVCGFLAPNEVICTDIPWATAWYGRRISVLVPQSVDEFKALSAAVPVKGLYLTTVTGDRPFGSSFVNGPWQSWLPVLNGSVPADFPLSHGISLPAGRRDQLFLTDSARWVTNK